MRSTDGRGGTKPTEPIQPPLLRELLVASAADPIRLRRISRALIRAGHIVVAGVHEPEELPGACADHRPHVVVLCWTSTAPGVAAADRISAAMPQTRIVVVLHEPARRAVRAAVAAGADGVVAEARLELTLPVVVEAVALGQASVPRAVRSALLGPGQDGAPPERRALGLVGDGLDTAGIARRLCLAGPKASLTGPPTLAAHTEPQGMEAP